MNGHGAKFGRKMEQAIAALLSHRSLEEAARVVGVSINTLQRWRNDPEFDAAYREARREAYLQSLLLLADASRAAVTTVMKIMLDANAPASARLNAAEIVLERGAAAIAIEEISARVAELERAVSAKGSPMPAVVLARTKELPSPEGGESSHG
jgi:hypothetical protein